MEIETTISNFEKIMHQFDIDGRIQSMVAYGNGHINDTYLTETEKATYIFQKINTNVFDAPALVANYSIISECLDDYYKKTGNLLSPQMVPGKSGSYHIVDEKGVPYRLVSFLTDSTSYDIASNTELTFQAARAFGNFQLFLNTLTPSDFQETICNFRDPLFRYKQFLAAVANARAERMDKAKDVLQQIEKNRHIIEMVDHLIRQNIMPTRITHNDTKLNNIVFSKGGAYVIDLDTVMPGFIIFDFGDMVRSFTSPAEEDNPDISRTCFRMDHFDALCSGYLSPLRETLSKNEADNLILGTISVIFVQALRFLSDYLQGDVYYKATYEAHNLVRAKTQLKLLSDLQEQIKKAQSIVDRYV